MPDGGHRRDACGRRRTTVEVGDLARRFGATVAIVPGQADPPRSLGEPEAFCDGLLAVRMTGVRNHARISIAAQRPQTDIRIDRIAQSDVHDRRRARGRLGPDPRGPWTSGRNTPSSRRFLCRMPTDLKPSGACAHSRHRRDSGRFRPAFAPHRRRARMALMHFPACPSCSSIWLAHR